MTDTTPFRHRWIEVDRIAVHVAEHGAPGNPVVLLLHGWPEDASAFAPVMRALGDTFHLAAIDLPGIGRSDGAAPAADKRALAGGVARLIDALGWDRVTLVGHDVGGQIVYACLHEHPERLARAVMMNIVVPGVEPWSQVIRNPHLWHFAFHAVPELPERLVAGHVARYFDFFYDALAARPDGVRAHARAVYAAAYAKPAALKAGFDWYRAFAQDERDNQRSCGQQVATPVLYLRGAREPGRLDDYVDGLRANGLCEVCGEQIADSGHFALDEQPVAVARAIRRFIGAA